jgi:hypothetical protein
MDQLEADLARPAFARKRPTLILTMRRQAGGGDELETAVLLYEQRYLGVGSRLFSADYVGAVKTVIAPEEQRPWAAFGASKVLLQRGALLVHVSYEGEGVAVDTAGIDHPAQGRFRWALKQRHSIGYLPVEDSVDATLANLGKHTRRNLRHYRRLVEADLGCVRIDHPQLTLDEFVEFSRISSYGAPDQAGLRFQTIQDMPSHSLFLGLKAANGDWLSLIGGRHEHDGTYVEWQLNREDLPSYSLCTAMRSHLIEHEVGRRTKRIYFIGGTTHSMRHYLVPKVKIADLVVLRYGLPGWATRRLSRSNNYVAEMLTNDTVEWHAW